MQLETECTKAAREGHMAYGWFGTCAHFCLHVSAQEAELKHGAMAFTPVKRAMRCSACCSAV